MRYELRDDALYLIMGPWSDKISYEEIIDVSVKDLVLNPLSSFRMPGVALFDIVYSDEGTVRMYSTHALKDVVLIKTLKKKYAISPKDENGFIAALKSKLANKEELVKAEKLGEKELIKKEFSSKWFSVIEIIVWLIVVTSFVVGMYFYPRLPNKLAVHWDAYGNVNGYLPKFIGIFLIPFLLVFISLIPVVIPKGSSQESYRRFRLRYYIKMVIILSVLFFTHIYMLLWNIGVKINFSVFSTILFGGIVISIIIQLIVFKPIKRGSSD
jgi:amino acid transporter